ncbi:hypothetical protein HAX54_029281 [Datura stramonium]|uniref:Uncharacterized protein n=1 Tax=Datura stramonium TaxID=4076 RepID=A0ABS8V666_DATST|nr:hypothetical protein [Datura stramonium]
MLTAKQIWIVTFMPNKRERFTCIYLWNTIRAVEANSGQWRQWERPLRLLMKEFASNSASLSALEGKSGAVVCTSDTAVLANCWRTDNDEGKSEALEKPQNQMFNIKKEELPWKERLNIKFDMTLTLVTWRSRKMCRERTNKSMIKNRQIQVIDNDRSHMRPMPGMIGLIASSSKDKKKAAPVKGPKSRELEGTVAS